MVRTFFKTVFRGIKSSLGRFFSIFAIVALGIGFLMGLAAATPDMKLSMDRYFDNVNMMDIFIKGTLGLTVDDAKALRDLAIVEKLSAAKVLDVPVTGSAGEFTARIYGIPLKAAFSPGAVNRLELLTGRMPQSPGECLADSGGDFIRLPPGTVINADPETENLNIKQFTITGTARSPLFISGEKEPGAGGNGYVSLVLYMNEDVFDLPFYTDFFITVKGAGNLNGFSDNYRYIIDAAIAALEGMGKARAPLRETELRDLAKKEAEKQLAAAEAAYREGKDQAARELAAAQRQLEDAERQIANAEAELVRGREELERERAKTKLELSGGEKNMREGEAELTAARNVLAEAKTQLDANRVQVEKTRASWLAMIFGKKGVAQYDSAVKQYEEGLARVMAETEKLEAGKRQIEEGKIIAEAEFTKAEMKLALGVEEVEKGIEQLSGGRREFELRKRMAETELAEAERKIREGYEEIQNLRIPESRWYVLGRSSNLGTALFAINIEKIADISRIFPLFFVLVAALVVFVTMTRMIEEDRLQIGTLKALGYRKRIISEKYLVYCGIAGIAGSAAGIIVGFRILPPVIHNAFAAIYHMPPPVTPIDWKLAITGTAAALLSVSCVTIISCYSSLREKPAALLHPRSPKPGKRILLEYIPFLWKPMKFTWKITARNLFRYKIHFAMTVTGIAGCTALMVAAFGLRDSLVDIARTQFSSILKYDLRIELSDDQSDPELEKMLTGRNRIALQSGSAFITDGRNRYSATAYTTEEGERLGEFIRLRNRKTGRNLSFSADAAIITEKIAELLGIAEGGELTLEDTSGRQASLTVTGITENYVGLPVYLGEDAWAQLFGRSDFSPLLFVKSGINEKNADSYLASIVSCDSVAGAELISAAQATWTRLLSSISYIVLVLIIAAAGLGGTVLFNLINININERRGELATLRVLGFRRTEAAAWVFREISILVLVGAGAGLVLGIPLHGLIISIAENPDLMFGRVIAPASFILSALFTLAFSVLVDIFMIPKITRINMAESLKSPD